MRYIQHNIKISGCVGLVIFSDPGDVAGEGQNQETDVYPETMFLPDTGIQRGSLLLFDGDPETPNMPSLPEGIYRLSKEEIDQENILPKIPCQPLGYRDAKEFMKVHISRVDICNFWEFLGNSYEDLSIGTIP